MSSDDESDMSTSSAEYLESSTKARREALKRKLEKVGQKDAATKPTADLKGLKLAMLRSQVSKKNDDQSKKDAEQRGNPISFVTKTREQEIAAEKVGGDSKPTADQMVDQGKQEDKKKEEMQKQGDVQSEGG